MNLPTNGTTFEKALRAEDNFTLATRLERLNVRGENTAVEKKAIIAEAARRLRWKTKD